MFRKALFLAAALATAAQAGAVVDKGRFTVVKPASGAPEQNVVESRHYTTIFSNIASRYPRGRYWPYDGWSPVGGANQIGAPEEKVATSFTPSADAVANRIELGLGYIAGEHTIRVSLYTDDDGIPGTPIKSWEVSDFPAIGQCCRLAVVNDRHGVPLAAGTTYWVVADADVASDAVAAWGYATTDAFDLATLRVWCSIDHTGGECFAPNDQWTAELRPNLAFGVFQKR